MEMLMKKWYHVAKGDENMKAEILCVGTELLLGDIVNTNAAYIAAKLAERGIDVYYQSVVGDNPDRLEESLDIAFNRCDMVVMTGGLGPTYDDLTKEIAARYFGKKLVMHQPSLDAIKVYFEKRGMEMTENNVKQAMLPEGAIVMPNHNGTAPGMIIKGKRKTAILLPGPPREMKSMWAECVRPYLESLSNEVIASHTIKIFGMGESAMEQKLHDYLTSHTNPTAAPYAKDGECLLRVTAKAGSAQECEQLMRPMMDELKEMLKGYVYGIDVPDIQTALVNTLKQRGLTVAAAESCTGGLVSKRITDVSGASGVFSYGICTYSNDAKKKLLGVSGKTLEEYGAVSRQTAIEMAKGVREVSGADIGISVTGVAGPEPSEGKPVGLVYVGVCYADMCEVKELNLGSGKTDDRELIRYISSSHALILAKNAAEKMDTK